MNLQMGMAMGQDPEILHEVCSWISKAATKPVWAKLSPNVTDITIPAKASFDAGCQGVAAINTIQVTQGVRAGCQGRVSGRGSHQHYPGG